MTLIGKVIPPIFMSSDIYSRYKFITDIIKKEKYKTVLDVGAGELDTIKKFFPKGSVRTLDVDCGDIRADGMNIPLKNNSFDVLTNVSVLQYIKKSQRKKFIKESLRVAKKALIISSAIKTKYVIEKSVEGNNYYKKIFKTDDEWLPEHTAENLPTKEEILDIIKSINKDFSVEIYPNGYLKRWWPMLKLNFLLLGTPLKILHPFVNFLYNIVFYKLDNIEPSYQYVFLIKKK